MQASTPESTSRLSKLTESQRVEKRLLEAFPKLPIGLTFVVAVLLPSSAAAAKVMLATEKSPQTKASPAVCGKIALWCLSKSSLLPPLSEVAPQPSSLPAPPEIKPTTTTVTKGISALIRQSIIKSRPTTTTSLPSPPGTIQAAPAAPSPPKELKAASIFERLHLVGQGVDISTPNCNAAVPSGLAFGIVSVTDKRNFTQNTCFSSEVNEFKGLPLSLYANTGYPGLANINGYANSPNVCGDEICLAYNYGHNAGKYEVDYANSQGVHSLLWWLDVETANSWSPDVQINQASIHGEFDAITQYAGQEANSPVTVGIYSTHYQWGVITGGLKGGWLNANVPDWIATATDNSQKALSYCKDNYNNFTGGYIAMVQSGQNKFDTDDICTFQP